MTTIVLNDIFKGAYSSVDGYCLYCMLNPYFLTGDTVELSMKGFPVMSSSFFNSSFGKLIDENGMDKLRSTIKFINITQSQANLIGRYLKLYSLEREH